MNQAPPPNLKVPMTTVTTAVVTAPEAVDEQADLPPLLLVVDVLLGHAGLGEGERGEHADGVERDQLGDVGLEDDHGDGGDDGQGDDAVGEHQPVAALGELLGQEPVVGGEAGQPGEVGEAGVGRQHQDEHGGAQGEHVEDVAERRRAVDGLGDLGDDRLAVAGDHVHLGGQPGDAEEHDAEQRAHDHRGSRGRASTRRGLKAGTPLEMASTPVMAAPPEAKAWSTQEQMLTEPVALTAAGSVGRHVVEAAAEQRLAPGQSMIIANMAMMNR